MNKKALQQYIENVVKHYLEKEDLSQEVQQEMSVSAGAGAFHTPFAFSSDPENQDQNMPNEDDEGQVYTVNPKKFKKFGHMVTLGSTSPLGENSIKFQTIMHILLEKVVGQKNYLLMKPLNEWNSNDIINFKHIVEKVPLTEITYKEYKLDSSMSPKKKVNESLIEVNRKLREINRILDHNIKLKEEFGVDASQYWKRTGYALGKIYERFVAAANKMDSIRKEYKVVQEDMSKAEKDAEMKAADAEMKAADEKKKSAARRKRKISVTPTTNISNI